MAVALDPSDPYYLQHSALAKSLAGLVNNFGDPNALTPEYMAEFGLSGNDVSAAAGNPYSTTHQLTNQLAGNQTQIQRTANAHGLFSGANAAATEHEIQAAGQRNYDARQSLSQQLAGLQTTDIGNLSDATARAAAIAAADPTVPATPAPIPTVAPNSSPGSPGIPTVTPTGAQTLPGYQIQGPQNVGTGGMTPIVKPPKLATPKISLGHV
jgi:hypothetical protein